MIQKTSILISAGLITGAIMLLLQPAIADVYVPGAKTKIHTQQTTNYSKTKPSTNSSQTGSTEEEAPPAEQKFGSSLEEMKAKVKAFSGNAESMVKIVSDANEKTIDAQKAKIIKICESMINNNGQLQELSKKLAAKEKNDQIKNILTRGVLANLQNVNRQLERVKQAAEKDKINYSNMKQQVERVDESIKQVIERMEHYEKQ